MRRRFPASSIQEGPVQAEALPEMPAVPADVKGPPANAAPAPNRKVDVVIPVYRGLEETLACIASARAGLPGITRSSTNKGLLEFWMSDAFGCTDKSRAELNASRAHFKI